MRVVKDSQPRSPSTVIGHTLRQDAHERGLSGVDVADDCDFAVFEVVSFLVLHHIFGIKEFNVYIFGEWLGGYRLGIWAILTSGRGR
jgi:hypothetical protein